MVPNPEANPTPVFRVSLPNRLIPTAQVVKLIANPRKGRRKSRTANRLDV
jgi:hypothetical protein